MAFIECVLRSSRRWRAVSWFAGSVAVVLAAALLTTGKDSGAAARRLLTPLETAEYTRLSTAVEINNYLAELDREFPQARVTTIGTSVQGRPIQAIVLSNAAGADVASSNRVTVEIIGCQHGTESAGAESLLYVARDLLAGSLQSVLRDVDVVLIPNANPDGRENAKRANANGINLNVDFVALTQPESKALVHSLRRFRPEVVLDVHESAVLKRKSLAREGYMTDFEVQFEYANNPNIAPSITTFTRRDVLGPWIAAVNKAGYKCHRYIGEIRSSRQPVTNGGLTLKNLRNRAGIEGSHSFLMETRLDPREGKYATFRNIAERVRKQRVAISEFLKTVHRERNAALVAIAASRAQSESVPLSLDAKYVAAVGHPSVTIDLRRISDGKLESTRFVDHRTVSSDTPLPLPAAYLVRSQQKEFAELFTRQGVEFEPVEEARTLWAVEFAPDGHNARAQAAVDRLSERTVEVRAMPGDLWVRVSEPRGRFASLILEPRSTSSVFRGQNGDFVAEPGKRLPICRIPQ